MSSSVPCWTKPLHRRTFPGEHADSAEELEIDSLRHQLREARAERDEARAALVKIRAILELARGGA